MNAFRGTGLLVCLRIVAALLAAQALPPTHVDDFTGKPRVVIISDIGNEPDDQMSFVRLLLYSNEFDIEAMIATTSTWQKSKTHPETMRELIDAYGRCGRICCCMRKGWPRRPNSAQHGVHGADRLRNGAVGDGQVVRRIEGDCARRWSAMIHGRSGSASGAARTRWRRR